MKKKIVVMAVMLSAFGLPMLTGVAYGQGTKISAFPVASAADANTSLAGIQLVSGSWVNERYSMAQLAAYINGAITVTLDQALTNGNVTDQTAEFFNGLSTLSISPAGVVYNNGTGFINSMVGPNSFIKDGSNHIWFAGGNINGIPGAYIKDAGSANGDTIDVAATSIGRRVAIQNNNRGRDTIPMKTYVDSILQASGNLQGVTNLGSTTTNRINWLNSTGSVLGLFDNSLWGVVSPDSTAALYGFCTNNGLCQLQFSLNSGGAGYSSQIDYVQEADVTKQYVWRPPHQAGTIVVDSGNNITGQHFSEALLGAAAPELSTYRVGGYINVTAVSGDVVRFVVSWTDENGISQAQNMSGPISSVGYVLISPVDIRVGSGYSFGLQTILTTSSGSITYDAGGNFEKIK